MELYFIEENKLVGFIWKKKYKGQAHTDTKTEEKLWKRNLRNKFYAWLGLTKFRLKLTK